MIFISYFWKQSKFWQSSLQITGQNQNWHLRCTCTLLYPAHGLWSIALLPAVELYSEVCISCSDMWTLQWICQHVCEASVQMIKWKVSCWPGNHCLLLTKFSFMQSYCPTAVYECPTVTNRCRTIVLSILKNVWQQNVGAGQMSDPEFILGKTLSHGYETLAQTYSKTRWHSSSTSPVNDVLNLSIANTEHLQQFQSCLGQHIL